MKKLISLMLAIVLCVALAAPAFAADEFVPSVSYKLEPRLISGFGANNEDVLGCLEITAIAEALDLNSDVRENIREDLVAAYDKIINGEIEFPYDTKKFVIRDLIDITFDKEICEANGHQHLPMKLTFDLGVGADALVQAYTYKNEKLDAVKEVTNNGDGTVTCVFEHLCPVLFVVNRTTADGTPNTGDNSAIGLYVAMMALSLCAGAALLSLRKKA